jgi:hypothetical protein
MLDQFGIGVKMHTLDVDGHDWTFRFREKIESCLRPCIGRSILFNLRQKDAIPK